MKPLLSLLALLLAILTGTAAAQSGAWSATGPVAYAATSGVSILMQNGKVLVAGGNIGGIGAVYPWAQVYDPAAKTFTATPNMKSGRNWPAGTLLPDGRVLVSGGSNGKLSGDNLVILKTAEFFNPATGTFSLSASKMKTPRANHTATLLPNGKVLLAGGLNAMIPRIRWGSCTNLAELYDPATDTFSSAGAMAAVHCGHNAVLLPNGKVLVVGGNDAELYDPATNTWTSAGTMNASHAGSAVLLANGKVLLAGATATSEIYDPAAATFKLTGNATYLYGYNTAALLPNGKVLLAGGPAGQCELYDPAAGTWSLTGGFNTVRFGFMLNSLADGRVLATDGSTSYQIMSAEVYSP